MPSEYLEKLLLDSAEAAQQIQTLAGDLSEESLQWRPGDESWSIAQILEHMTTTSKLYGPGLDRLIEKAARKRPYRGEAFEPTWLGGGFAKYIGPEGEAKMKAPKRFQPAPRPDPGSLERFLDEQIVLDGRMRASMDFNLRRWKIRSPAFILMRFTMGDAYALLVGHAQRHIHQAQALGTRSDFPSA